MGRPTSSNEPGYRVPSASNTRSTGGSCLRRLRIIPLPQKRMVTGQGDEVLVSSGTSLWPGSLSL
jgi:hypothetical protein